LRKTSIKKLSTKSHKKKRGKKISNLKGGKEPLPPKLHFPFHLNTKPTTLEKESLITPEEDNMVSNINEKDTPIISTEGNNDAEVMEQSNDEEEEKSSSPSRWSRFKSSASNAASKVKSSASNAASKVKSSASNAASGIKNTASNAASGIKNKFKRNKTSSSESINKDSANLGEVTNAIKNNTKEIHEATDAIKNSSFSANPLTAFATSEEEPEPESEPKVIKEECNEPLDEQTIKIRLPKGANMIAEGGPSVESKMKILVEQPNTNKEDKEGEESKEGEQEGGKPLQSPFGGSNSKKQRRYKLRKRSRKRQKNLEKK